MPPPEGVASIVRKVVEGVQVVEVIEPRRSR
jgi:hypothetical protein